MDYISGLFLCTLGSFLKVIVQNGDIFRGCSNFKYFFGVLKIPDIFFLECRVEAWPEPTYAEKMRVTPPPPPGVAPICAVSSSKFENHLADDEGVIIFEI